MMMKKMKKLLMMMAAVVTLVSCSTVPAGNVGVKFYLLGSDKGVDYDVLTPGRYYIGVNEKLYLFPTQHQTMVWTADQREGSPNDEHFDFQSKEGLQLKGNFAIEYHITPENVPQVFETYKRGAREVSQVVLRNVMRDAINEAASHFTASEIFGEKKMQFMDSVRVNATELAKVKKFTIDNVYLLGNIIPPKAVKDALDNKIKAKEIAQQKENELRQTEADAKKKIAAARGEAESILLKAEAQAKANQLISRSITKNLFDYKKIDKWNGEVSKVTGGSGVLLNMN
jgi:regulator of protease activity HflC (stomatin/prohibitin superfamily)